MAPGRGMAQGSDCGSGGDGQLGWMRDVNDETRSRLAVAWDYQSKHLGDLVSTSSALLTTIRQMQVATRRRVLLEMAGLLMVAVGTVLSRLPVDRG